MVKSKPIGKIKLVVRAFFPIGRTRKGVGGLRVTLAAGFLVAAKTNHKE
jgi:hypothetical protein